MLLRCAGGVCGDGVLDDGEACDDGNLDNGDGCDSLCTGEEYDFITGEESWSNLAKPAGEVDVFRFTVDNDPTRFRAETNDGAAGCPAGHDTRLYLFDAHGVQVAENDDSGAGLCSLLDVELAPGDYELQVQEFGDNNVLTGYSLDLLLEVDVSAGGAFDGGFPAEGEDQYLLSLDADCASVVLETGDGAGGCPPGDTRLYVYDSDDNLLDDNDDGGIGLCSRMDLDLLAGDYTVIISGFGASAVDAYVLEVVKDCEGGGAN